jgi:protoporphyrinogen/coproporphyrinogen III oxidase
MKLDDVEIYKNTRVSSIEKVGEHYQVVLANQEIIESDNVVLSTPHTAAEVLFSNQELKNEFGKLKNSSLISIYVGYDVPDEQLPEDGTGFITASSEELACNACTWTSRKWKHTSFKGNLLVRLFYKSSHPSFVELEGMSEEELLEVAMQDIAESLGITSEPVVSKMTKWNDSMPNYLITHPKTVQALENKLKESYPGILLAGCSYYGVGIPDCIENGVRTARKIIEKL